jgi:hypothetical protein
MSKDSVNKYCAFSHLWKWVTEQIVQDVPEEIVRCEFGCRKQQCTGDEWETCERRITPKLHLL